MGAEVNPTLGCLAVCCYHEAALHPAALAVDHSAEYMGPYSSSRLFPVDYAILHGSRKELFIKSSVRRLLCRFQAFLQGSRLQGQLSAYLKALLHAYELYLITVDLT